jgi:hypothetical protein
LNKGISRGASNPQHHARKDSKSSKLSNPKHKSGRRGSIRSEAPIVIKPEIQTKKIPTSNFVRQPSWSNEIQTKKIPTSNFVRQPSWSNPIGNEQLTICQETVRETDDKCKSLSGHSEDIEAIIVRDLNRHGPSTNPASQVGGFLRKLTSSTIGDENRMRVSHTFLSRKNSRADGNPMGSSFNKMNALSVSQNI